MKSKGSILLSDEIIKGKLKGTFEINQGTGIEYWFGELLATDKRLVLHTKYPFGYEEATEFKYKKIIRVDIRHSLLLFHNDISIKANMINDGNVKQLLERIALMLNRE